MQGTDFAQGFQSNKRKQEPSLSRTITYNLQTGIQEENQQVIQEHLVMTLELEFEVAYYTTNVQTDNAEQKLVNTVVSPGDDDVKRQFSS